MKRPKAPRIHGEKIKFKSDYQINWYGVIQPLKRGHYKYESTSFLAIPGDAPKNFLRIYEYRVGVISNPKRWPGFIAKVGSKWYPIESVTEHLLTRIGQVWGLQVADSQLRIVGKQVRFLSRYFLGRNESLTHGAELFVRLLDAEIVSEIANSKQESEIFTVQTVREAVEDAFPDHKDDIIDGFLRMLGFDAIVGHNDRHAYNWGVIVPVGVTGVPQFSPLYDTARALFWNASEEKIRRMLADRKQLTNYINRCRPQIGWDGYTKVGHFQLLELLTDAYPEHRPVLAALVRRGILERVYAVIDQEFEKLMSHDRRQLIKLCLLERYRLYCQAIGEECEYDEDCAC